jgi:hypothetical protein
LRSRITWAIVGVVAVVTVAAVVDGLRSSRSPVSSSKASPAPQQPADQISLPTEQESVAPPRCSVQQLALKIENLGGVVALALVHGRAGPCRTSRLPIEVAVLDRAGEPVEATLSVQPAFAPTTLSPDGELSAPFSFVYLCGEPKPVRVVAEAGPYAARGRLPRRYAACVDDLGPSAGAGMVAGGRGLHD